MSQSLGSALSRVNRLANRLRLDDRPDPAKMSNEELCAEAVELSLKATGCLVRDFQSYGEFVEAISKIGVVVRSFPPMVVELQQRLPWRACTWSKRRSRNLVLTLRSISAGTRSREHVIPAWLQEHLGVADELIFQGTARSIDGLPNWKRVHDNDSFAERLKVNEETVRRLFLCEPGVIVICCPRKGTRVYRTLRIPESVYRRVVTRLTKVA